MIDRSVHPTARQEERRRRPKCRTNVGRHMSLAAAYYAGRLPQVQAERFEDLVRELRALYSEAGL